MTQLQRVRELMNNKKQFSIREIVDYTGYPAPSVRRILGQGEKAGIFSRTIPGHYKLIKKH